MPIEEGITGKPSYADKITKPNSTSSSTKQERERVIARQSTHNGMPAIIFKALDYYGIMAEECRYTLVGRFLRARPQIDKIRSQFREKIAIKGSSIIGVYDNYNVFIDLANEDGFKAV